MDITKKVGEWVKKNIHFITAALALLALLSLLFPVLTYRTKIEGVKTYYTVNIIDILTNKTFGFNWFNGVIVCLIVLGGVIAIVEHYVKQVKSLSSILLLVALGLSVVTLDVFLRQGEYEYVLGLDKVEANVGYALSIVFLVSAIATSLSSSGATKMSTKDIAEDGILIALAFVLNFVKLPIATGGGSVNFQMLPLFIIALRHGPYQGLVCSGLVYGLLTCLTDGYGFVTFPFDYLIGFGSAAIVGFFAPLILNGKDNYNVKGELFLFAAVVLSTLMRFVGSTVSSMVVYGYNLEAAALYNAIYIPVSGAIAGAVIMLAYGPLLKINKLFPVDR